MLSRRHFLGLGGAAAAALATSSLRPRAARAAAAGSRKNLIVVMAQGGWDVTYALDPKEQSAKVDVPAGAARRFGNLDIMVDASRPNVTAFFTRYAERSAVIRGITLTSISHTECVKRILTGGRSNANPDVAAAVAHELGRDLPIPYLILGDHAFTGPYAVSSGRVGATNQVVALADEAQRYNVIGETASPFSPDAGDRERVRKYLLARAERERAVRGAAGYNKKRIDDFSTAMTKADRLIELRAGLGARGRSLSLESQSDLAIEALVGGIAHSVSVNSRLTWDTHDNNADQAVAHEALYAGVTHLADGLAARRGLRGGATLLDETVVLVVSELSRTPKLNAQLGKDHWPVTSALVFGGGVNGGRAWGGTSASLDPLLIDYATGAPSADGKNLETKNFAAGILSLCGADPAAHFPAVEPFDAYAA